MESYSWLRLLHMLAAITWVGAGISVVAFTIRASQAGHGLRFARDMQVVGPRLGAPSSLILLITGVWMVMVHPGWGFGQPWIAIALAIFAISFAIGLLFHGPNFKRLSALADERGETAPEVQAALRRTFLVTRFEVGLLVIAVLDMIWRPSF